MVCNTQTIGVKSKFGAEFRRFSINRSKTTKFDEFYNLLEKIHKLASIPFVIQYVHPEDNCFLPINNDTNLASALSITEHSLRIVLQRKGESYGELYGYSATKPSRQEKSATTALLSMRNTEKYKPTRTIITLKDDFQLVCSILDANILPREMRRVRLLRTPHKQLGLFIRGGLSTRLTESGYERVPGFFISRLDEDGIAASTGLLAVNDELIEVNGIEVFDKTLDQVTDMMVANSSNLIITVRPSAQAASQSTLPLTNHYNANTVFNAYQADSVSRNRPPVPPRGPHHSSTANHQHGDTDEDEEDLATGLITL